MKNSPQLTPWFPASVKPVRPGIYERKAVQDMTYRFSFWSGRRWLLTGRDPEEASDHGNAPSARQDLQWRGLAKEPK